MKELLMEFLGNILEANKFKAVKIGKGGSSDRIVYFSSAERMQQSLDKGTHRKYKPATDSHLDKKAADTPQPSDDALLSTKKAEIVADVDSLVTAINTGDKAQVEKALADTGFHFSRTGKPIFVKDGVRTDVYPPHQSKKAKEVGEKIKNKLREMGVDVDALVRGRSSGPQYPPTKAFEYTRADGSTTPMVSAPREITINNQPVVVRDIIDPDTGTPIEVTTDEGRARAVRVIDEMLSQLTQGQLAEALKPGINSKQFLGNVGELAVLKALLATGNPAYLLKASTGKNDIVIIKSKEDQTEVAVYFSAKSTKDNTTVAGFLGANALSDLHATVVGKTVTVDSVSDTGETVSMQCPAPTEMTAIMDVHGMLINRGMGDVNCGDPKHVGKNQSSRLQEKPIDDTLIGKVKTALSKNTDKCYQALVAKTLQSLQDSKTLNLGGLEEFSRGQFARVMKETDSSAKSAQVDIGAVSIEPDKIGQVLFVKSDSIDAAVSASANSDDYKGNTERQLTDLLGLRFSTRCVNNRYSRIINTRHPLHLLKNMPDGKQQFKTPEQYNS